MSDAEQVRVLIVDDDHLVRMALRLVLDAAPDLTVVGEASDGDAALTAVTELEPHVVVMDVRMPGRDGIDATRELLNRSDPPRVLMLTTFDTDDMVVAALRAGALGFVLKDTPPAQLIDAVRAVADGQPSLSPQTTARLIDTVTRTAPAADRSTTRDAARVLLDTLTDRELDTARAVADGLDNAEIAERLFISVATVKAHIGALFTKLAVRNRVQVALLVRDAEDPAP